MSGTGEGVAAGDTDGQGSGSSGGEGFTPITSQEQLNQIIGDRVKRAKPADYDDLKAKAARLDELEDANRSDVEKAVERATKAEAEVEALPQKVAEALRGHLVALGVVDKADEVLLTASTPDDLLAQVTRITQRNSDRKKQGNVVPREGATPPPVGTDAKRAFVRSLTGVDQ